MIRAGADLEKSIKSVMGNSSRNDALFKRVRELHLPNGKFALFGSAPMGIRAIKDCHDIDIIVTEELWDEYQKKKWKVRMVPNGSSYLWRDEIELWKDWKPGEWNVGQLIKNAEMIVGLPFVRLEEVVKWKKLNGREKDLRDIDMIEQFQKRNEQ